MAGAEINKFPVQKEKQEDHPSNIKDKGGLRPAGWSQSQRLRRRRARPINKRQGPYQGHNFPRPRTPYPSSTRPVPVSPPQITARHSQVFDSQTQVEINTTTSLPTDTVQHPTAPVPVQSRFSLTAYMPLVLGPVSVGKVSAGQSKTVRLQLSLGSIILAWGAFSLLLADVFVDTMRYAFALGLSELLFHDVPIGAYVY
ncbi:hypothetical protein GE09DRAFT_1220638 [Coniochaeta sp. 2T2.1]|nr:hypothetical protein GE09DRAFT_1220638 [Coniochaeta sp. 2T2.1]